jgi:hypothetical protein
MDSQIINLVKEKGQIIGVLLQLENGETQYLTIEDYNNFINKKENGK